MRGWEKDRALHEHCMKELMDDIDFEDRIIEVKAKCWDDMMRAFWDARLPGTQGLEFFKGIQEIVKKNFTEDPFTARLIEDVDRSEKDCMWECD